MGEVHRQERDLRDQMLAPAGWRAPSSPSHPPPLLSLQLHSEKTSAWPPLHRLKDPVAHLGSELTCPFSVTTHAAAEVQNPVVRRDAVSLLLPVPG